MAKATLSRVIDEAPPVEIRPAGRADRSAILSLLTEQMGWVGHVPAADFFAWKHDQNVFGISPAWGAWDAGRLVGFRTMLRWQFVVDGKTVEGFRPVDTVTDPSVRRRGVFRALTLRAMDDLRASHPDALIFNTPNLQSRPGYLKMGWTELGRPKTWTQVRRITALPSMARSRVPAERWSQPADAGVSIDVALEDEVGMKHLLCSQPDSSLLRTRLSPEFLRWRYGFGPLRYRVITGRGGVRDGIVVVRARRRGAVLETVVSDVILPDGVAVGGSRLITQAGRALKGDYVLHVGSRPGRSWMRLAHGPVLTARTLSASAAPPLAAWDLRLGDIELF